MSLLLDALKRAEDAKRAARGAAAPKQSPTAAPSSATIGGAAAQRDPVSFPALSLDETSPPVTHDTVGGGLELELLDSIPEASGEFEIEPPPYATDPKAAPPRPPAVAPPQRRLPTSPPSIEALAVTARSEPGQAQLSVPATEIHQTATQREAVQNAFAAKKNAVTSVGSRWLIPAALIFVGVIGAGWWYVWNEKDRAAKAAPSRAESAPPAAATPANPVAPVVVSKASPVPVEAELPPLLPPPSIAAPLPHNATAAPSAATLSGREELARDLQEFPPPKNSPIRLQLSRDIESPTVPPALLAAYAALSAGDYGLARQRYAQLIEANPNDVDAHLGFATAAARTGEAQLAATHYRRVLEFDPRNSVAASGLAALSGGTDRGATEGDLKALLAKDNSSAALHFSLGNFYTAESRWQDAQAAYFEAHRLDQGNGDYAYNLAVALDRLSQPRLALDYYQKALRAATRGQFDRAAVERRVAELGAR